MSPLDSRASVPTILGLGGSDHDVHACVISDGVVQVAIEEERLSRCKYGIGGNLLDGLARRRVLKRASLTLGSITDVVADAILPKTALLAVRSRVRLIDHHLCHAAAAFFTSGMESAAVVVVDNAGGLLDGEVPSLQATTWYRAEGREINPVGQVVSTNWKEGPEVGGAPYQKGDGDHSLGHLFKKVSGALGFRFPHGADPDGFFFPEDGITMGLAAYAAPAFASRLSEVVELLPDGQFRIALNDGRLDAILRELLADSDDDFQRRAAVASSAQDVLQRVLCHVVEHALAVTGETNLCLSGGVAMNSVANAHVLRNTRVKRLYVPPVPGDNGTGIGAALWVASRERDRPVPRYSVYSGGAYGSKAIAAAASGVDAARFDMHRYADDALLPVVAELLAAGKVVAWFNGGSEGGRRALGNRSILAAAQSADMRDHINAHVKQRHWFRPLAPVVPAADASRYFEMSQPSPYMQIVFQVRPEWRTRLGAVTHVDGSARVQTVDDIQNSRLLHLLRAYERVAGIPILLNTSFNGRGEPIVETPEEAVACLHRMPLDALVLDDYLLVRK